LPEELLQRDLVGNKLEQLQSDLSSDEGGGRGESRDNVPSDLFPERCRLKEIIAEEASEI
jgi:hypothetical protein